jgi:hypothetical protein
MKQRMKVELFHLNLSQSRVIGCGMPVEHNDVAARLSEWGSKRLALEKFDYAATT